MGWLITSVLLSTIALILTLTSGNVPLLGLDLQGGVSVVLEPVGDVDGGRLEQAKDIVTRRVDGLGVAEPEISIQGNNILVQIPGIDDPDRALELVGQTAELRFRPVLREEPSLAALEGLEDVEIPTTLAPDATALPGDTTATTASSTTASPTTAPGATGAPTTMEPTASTVPTEGGDEVGLGAGESAATAQGTDTTALDETGAPATTGAPVPVEGAETDDGTGTTLAPPTGGPTTLPPPITPEVPTGLLADAELTTRAENVAESTVVLAQFDDDGTELSRFELGPAVMTGQALRGAQAVLDPQSSRWVVNPQFKSGSPGIDDLNAIAPACVSQSPECPSGRLAIVLDQEVISAPSISVASFEPDQIQISGAFGEREAKDLALVLRYGALPVVLEPQAAQVVSATVGDDALAAGVLAGLIGLALAAIYMLVLYRFLGLVALISLSLSGAWLYAIVTYLSDTRGLALTLAGVTGLIVSIGTTLDSNIVYFEHLKEDVRLGRSLRSATSRSFESSFRTIVAANMVSLIGAAILYWMTVGGVRGFALFLGLSTVMDLLATWFFLRPTVTLIGRSNWFRDHPRALALTPPPPEESSAVSTPKPTPVGAPS